jgi:hypothetical protein
MGSPALAIINCFASRNHFENPGEVSLGLVYVHDGLACPKFSRMDVSVSGKRACTDHLAPGLIQQAIGNESIRSHCAYVSQNQQMARRNDGD